MSSNSNSLQDPDLTDLDNFPPAGLPLNIGSRSWSGSRDLVAQFDDSSAASSSELPLDRDLQVPQQRGQKRKHEGAGQQRGPEMKKGAKKQKPPVVAGTRKSSRIIRPTRKFSMDPPTITPKQQKTKKPTLRVKKRLPKINPTPKPSTRENFEPPLDTY